MIGYLWAYSPFDTRLNNGINLYNEFVLMSAFSGTVVMNTRQFSSLTISVVGWILIGTVLISLGIIWVTMMPPAIKALVETVISWCSKKGADQSAETTEKLKKEDGVKEMRVCGDGAAQRERG